MLTLKILKGGLVQRKFTTNKLNRNNQNYKHVNKNFNYFSSINAIEKNQIEYNKCNYKSYKKVKGFAIFNNTLIEYLYDSGSDTTLITENLLRKIQLEDINTKLVQYIGKPLKSFTSEVKIIGQLNLDKCSFNQTDNLNDIKIVVTENQESMNGCIIGTDLMKQIPEFDSAMQQLEETIKNMSNVGVLLI